MLTLQQSGFAAHPKRRGPGRIRITLEQLKGQLYQQVPDLRRTHPQLSNSTVGHLMLPPNKHGNSAKHYKGIVKARSQKPRNNLHATGDNV